MDIRCSLVFFLALAACSGTGSSGSSSDAAAADGCAPTQGAGECNLVSETFCAGIYKCCAPNGVCSSQCAAWACDSTLAQCKSQLVQVGSAPDCSAIPNQKDVCPARSCLDDIGTLTCSDYFSSGTAMPASCDAFFAQL